MGKDVNRVFSFLCVFMNRDYVLMVREKNMDFYEERVEIALAFIFRQNGGDGPRHGVHGLRAVFRTGSDGA